LLVFNVGTLSVHYENDNKRFSAFKNIFLDRKIVWHSAVDFLAKYLSLIRSQTA